MAFGFFVIYDPQTGDIKGRLHVANRENAIASGGHMLFEISEEEFHAVPELHKKLNLQTMVLEDK